VASKADVGLLCQAHYSDTVGQGTLSAKRAFYHKTYQRARGIIAQVEMVGDSIAWLADSCAMATEGSDDVEKVSVELNLTALAARHSKVVR